LTKIIILEENFKWHLKAFASDLLITHTYTHTLNICVLFWTCVIVVLLKLCTSYCDLQNISA